MLSPRFCCRARGPTNAECNASSCTCNQGFLNCEGSCLADHSNEACGSCSKQCMGAYECTTGDLCKICSTGCAVLTTGAKNNAEFAAYTIPLNPHRNLNNTELTMRLYGFDAADTYLMAYVVNSDEKASAVTATFDAGVGWYDLTLITTPNGGYDFSDVKQIDLAVGVYVDKTRATPSKIYVDGLNFEVGSSFDFSASSSPLVFSSGTSNVGNSNTTGSVTRLAPN